MTAENEVPRYEPFLTHLHPTLLGLWIFIATEALFFGILIASYLYLRMRAISWPPAGVPELELLLPAANTVVLLSSGFTMHGALASLRQGDLALFRGGVAITLFLGAVFLLGQGFEYLHAGFGLGDGLLGSSFFTLTGFHGAHVLVGLILLAVLLPRVDVAGAPGERRQVGMEAAGLYWHFVDAVWVVLFTVLYLV